MEVLSEMRRLTCMQREVVLRGRRMMTFTSLNLKLEAMSLAENALIPRNIPVSTEQFAASRNMHLVRKGGQRIYGPSGQLLRATWTPEKGSEIFITCLPRDCVEQELVPLLERVAPIYQLRLMMNFKSDYHKGYGFAKFYCPQDADRAVELLRHFQIRPQVALCVRKSFDNNRLALTGIPTYKSPKEVFDELERFSGGLERVILSWEIPPERVETNGKVTAIYKGQSFAAFARRKMLSRSFYMWGYKVKVEWAEPEVSGPAVMCTPPTEVLRVNNLAPRTCNHALRHIFMVHSHNGVINFKRVGSSAFIHFRCWEKGETARRVLNGYNVDGFVISVEWINPGFIPYSNGRESECRRQ